MKLLLLLLLLLLISVYMKLFANHMVMPDRQINRKSLDDSMTSARCCIHTVTLLANLLVCVVSQKPSHNNVSRLKWKVQVTAFRQKLCELIHVMFAQCGTQEERKHNFRSLHEICISCSVNVATF